MSDGIVVLKHSIAIDVDGTPRVHFAGETFREDDPIIKGRESAFGPFQVDNEIERATARPGQKRQAPPKSKPEPKPEEKPAEPQGDDQGDAEKAEAPDDTGAAAGAEVDATEAAVKAAAEAGIELASVEGTGKDGRITADDVKAHLEAAD